MHASVVYVWMNGFTFLAIPYTLLKVTRLSGTYIKKSRYQQSYPGNSASAQIAWWDYLCLSTRTTISVSFPFSPCPDTVLDIHYLFKNVCDDLSWSGVGGGIRQTEKMGSQLLRTWHMQREMGQSLLRKSSIKANSGASRSSSKLRDPDEGLPSPYDLLQEKWGRNLEAVKVTLCRDYRTISC